jgi:hypothetical protein
MTHAHMIFHREEYVVVFIVVFEQLLSCLRALFGQIRRMNETWRLNAINDEGRRFQHLLNHLGNCRFGSKEVYSLSSNLPRNLWHKSFEMPHDRRG